VSCIGEPISWPRLERFAVDRADPAIAAHVTACPACRACLDRIRLDDLALPPLVVAAARRGRRWLAPMVAAAAAAAIALVVLRRPVEDRLVVGLKGVGEVALELVRERAGAIAFEARSYAPGDRWKVVVSCPPGAAVWVDVSVADGRATDHPLGNRPLACGNRVAVPGAFTITGAAANRICVRVAGGAEAGTEAGTACTTVRPE